VDVSDEIHVEALRSALASGDRQQPLDLAALLKAPDKLKKACRAGIPMAQRKQAWEAIVKLNTTSQSLRQRQPQPQALAQAEAQPQPQACMHHTRTQTRCATVRLHPHPLCLCT